METLIQIPALVQAFSQLLWPFIVLIIFFCLLKPLRKLIETMRGRSFKIKIGDKEIEVGDYIEQQTQLINDLQNKYIQKQEDKDSDVPAPFRVLWVDDQPENNVLLESNLADFGAIIDHALSTSEALSNLQAFSYDALISDMGRQEGKEFIYDAGCRLLKEIREQQKELPVFIFTTAQNAKRFKDTVRILAGTISSSATDLLSWTLKRAGTQQRS